MSADSAHIQQLMDRLRRLLEKAGEETQVETVHHLRTHIRRVESLLQALPAEPFKGQRKLLKRLKRLRRRAGRVRDLDVQLAALTSFSRNHAASAQQQLQRRLEQKRSRQAGKLRRRLAPSRLRKLQRGLQAAADHLQAAAQRVGPAARRRTAADVHRRFLRMKRPLPALTDDEVHTCRIQCKRLRYRLEAMGDDARAHAMIAALKQIQDAVGAWHDWLTLTGNAEKLLPAKPAKVLVPALQQATARRRRQALRVMAAVREQWSRLG